MARSPEKTLERSVENHLIEEVERLQWQHRKMNRNTGDPDQLVLAGEGLAVFFELKRPVGGKLSPAQVIRHEELRALGYRVLVCETTERVDAALRTIQAFVRLRRLG